MALTRTQRRTARKILNVGTRRGESRKEKLAALVTALTEANLGNPAGGHGTSAGWRQEIDTYGSVRKRRNVKGAAKRFYSETSQQGSGKGMTVGGLAQAVQRSAFPDRYQTHVGDAKEILAAYNQGRLGSTGGSYKRSRTRKTTRTTPGVDNSELRQQLKLSYLEGRHDPDALLALAAGLKSAQDVPGKTTTKTRTVRGKRSGKSSIKGLKVVRDDNHGAKALVEFATRGIYGSGERTPAQNAATGGAPGSDHLTTNRWASAVDAKYGTGKLIAKRLGIKGWKKGTYDRHTITVKGRRYSVQILEDVEGHFDHAHVGIQRVK